MSEVSRVLSAIEQGSPHAAADLLPLVYEELRRLAAARLAQEPSGQTLQPTALVHEAYLRLVDSAGGMHFNSRGHFFAAAAEAMRRILIENARKRACLKRGGDRQRVDLDELVAVADDRAEQLLALDDALARLAQSEPVKAQVVNMRYFAGMTLEEVAECLGISLATVKRHWMVARAWLYAALAEPTQEADEQGE